jgi:hypothetical protein
MFRTLGRHSVAPASTVPIKMCCGLFQPNRSDFRSNAGVGNHKTNSPKSFKLSLLYSQAERQMAFWRGLDTSESEFADGTGIRTASREADT